MICSTCGHEIAGQEIGESGTGEWCTCTDSWGYRLGTERATPSLPPLPGPWGSPAGPDPFTLFPLAGETYQPPRHRRRKVTVALLVCLLLAGGAVVVDHYSAKPLSAQASVIAAAHRTAAQRTAQMSMDLSIGAGGGSLTAEGNGNVDFTSDALQLDLDVSAPFGEFHLPMIFVGGTLYESIPDLGQVEPGKEWVSIDISPGSSSGQPSIFFEGGGPTGLDGLFSVPEADVTPGGPATVDDLATHRYLLTFSETGLQQLHGDPRVPAPLRDSLPPGVISITGTAQVDHSGRLAEESVDMTVQGAAAGSLSETIDYSGYGSQTDIAAPPADLVVPLPQFQHDSGSGGEQVL